MAYYDENLQLGGKYTFINCTFANFWSKDKAREKPTLNINNYTDTQVLPLDSCYFGNCIIDGTLENEISLDLKYSSPTPTLVFSSCWMRNTSDLSNVNTYLNVRTGSSLNFRNTGNYDFSLPTSETQVQNYNDIKAQTDVSKFPYDIRGSAFPRNLTSVTAGAYEVN